MVEVHFVIQRNPAQGLYRQHFETLRRYIDFLDYGRRGYQKYSHATSITVYNRAHEFCGISATP